MAWPVTVIDTANMDDTNDDPDLARPEIQKMAEHVNAMVDYGAPDTFYDLESGTKLAFPQNVAPTGWTLLSGYDGRGIQLTDTLSEGGDTDGSSEAFAPHSHSGPSHRHDIDHGHGDDFSNRATTIAVSTMPSHRHGFEQRDATGSNGSTVGGTAAADAYTHYVDYTGDGNSHTHTQDGSVTDHDGKSDYSGTADTGSFSPKYVKAIVCQRD